jgi:hypothetical protein
MKNQIKKALIMLLIASGLASCKKLGLCRDEELAMNRASVTRPVVFKMNGCYIETPPLTFNNIEQSEVMVFFENGVFQSWGTIPIGGIEGSNSILTSTQINDYHSGWGVYKIDGRALEIEHWDIVTPPNRCLGTVLIRGEILNDSTLRITSREGKRNGEFTVRAEEQTVFRFRRLAQKPDSTNQFIK